MREPEDGGVIDCVPVKRPAYDPKNPLDDEARKYDDTSEGIDWDEILATTEDDFQAGRFAFNTADYPTEEEAMAAMKRWFDAIVEKVMHGSAPVSALHAESGAGS